MIPVASPLRRVFFPQTPRSLPLLPGKPLAVEKASAKFALDREQSGYRHVRRKIWRRPKSVRLLERTDRSAVRGRYRAGTALLREAEWLGWACFFLGVREIRLG